MWYCTQLTEKWASALIKQATSTEGAREEQDRSLLNSLSPPITIISLMFEVIPLILPTQSFGLVDNVQISWLGCTEGSTDTDDEMEPSLTLYLSWVGGNSDLKCGSISFFVPNCCDLIVPIGYGTYVSGLWLNCGLMTELRSYVGLQTDPPRYCSPFADFICVSDIL